MACCIAIAFVFGVVRGAWFRVFPSRRPTAPGFAPPAFRAAPGSMTTASPATVAVAERPPVTIRTDSSIAAIARGIAIGTLTYAVTVFALLTTGLAASSAGGSWFLRDVALVLVATAALITALALHSPTPGRRHLVLLAIGAAWVELGFIDMHVLGLFEFPHYPLLLDLLFHGSGFVLLALALPGSLPSTTRRPREAIAQ